MAKKDVQIEVTNLAEVKASIRQFGKDADKTMDSVIWKTALGIELVSKNLLRGLMHSARHYVTGRLATSVHIETADENTFEPIKDSKAEDRSLGVNLGKFEAAVGTNVEYAQKIEDIDSFIRWPGENYEPKLVKEAEKQYNEMIAKKEFNDKK